MDKAVDMNQETRAYLGMMQVAGELLRIVVTGSVEPPADDGCNDAAGSEVAQVRKLETPDRPSTDPEHRLSGRPAPRLGPSGGFGSWV